MAISFDQPVGNPLYGPMILRLVVGAYLIIAGIVEYPHIIPLIGGVKQMRILPDPFDTLYGVLLPFFDLAAGAFLALGLYTTLAGILSCIMTIPFLVSQGFLNDGFLRKEVLILGAVVSLMYSGAGAFSMDRFRKGVA